MRPIVGVVECVSPLISGSQWWVMHTLKKFRSSTGGYHTLEQYTMFVEPLFQISGNVSGIRNLSMRLGLAVLRKRTTNVKCFRGMASSYVCDGDLGDFLE